MDLYLVIKDNPDLFGRYFMLTTRGRNYLLNQLTLSLGSLGCTKPCLGLQKSAHLDLLKVELIEVIDQYIEEWKLDYHALDYAQFESVKLYVK